MLTTTSNIFRFLKHFGFKTPPLSIALVFIAQMTFVQIIFVQVGSAQISGPCGLTLTVTNTSNSYTNDGKLTVSGVVGRFRMWVVKPDGTTIGMGEYSDVSTTQSQYLTGLLPGNYTLYYEKYDANWTYACGGNQAFTIASGALPTCVTTEIGGFTFHDFNANGTRDNSDAGAAGITVNAYNTTNTLAATTTSSSTGAYKLTGLTVGQPYRLEFSWTDGYLQSGAVGTNATSSVQFVNAGTCAANFSVNLPSSYCQTNNPLVMLPCYVNGSATAPAVTPMDALVAFPYNAYSQTDVSTQSPTVSHIATVGQVGAMWAMAYQKTSKVMFGGAVLRRYSGFGSLGTGGIYKIDMTNPTTPSVAPWIDVKTIGIPTGTDTRNGTPANTLSNSPGTPAWDAEAFNQIGKLGIGGMDFNETGDTLWLVNMTDRKLYGIKNVNPSVTPTAANVLGGYSIALPSGYACASGAGDFRPWAIKYYKGLIYIGALCSGESTQWTPANLRGYILSFNPANPAAGFTHVANFPLNYSRRHYGTSTNVFQSWINNSFYKDYIIQPIVTDLEFDIDGSIIVGIADRGGLQMGNQNYRADPSASDYTLTNGDTYGDILKICRVGSSFVAEGNVGCSYPTNPFGTPEFYWGDHAPFAGSERDFMDNAAGSLAFTQGNGTFLTTMQDAAIWNSGGVTAFSPISGGDVRRYTVYDPSVPGAAGKATGLGDIEPLCDPAPIEIGNRVWSDTDVDGIQDAGEPGMYNVTVKLYNVTTWALVATTTTDASGHYKFTNLAINTQYRIEISMTDPQVGGRALTGRDAGTNDFIDNDAQNTAGIASITLTTGTYGQNNHTYDFGFNPCTSVVGGTVGPATQTICTNQGIVSTQHTLTGNVGTVLRWEYQAPSSSTWNDWGGGGSTTAPSNCCFSSIGTWKVRAIIQNSAFCPQATSSEAQIIVVADPSVSIASNASTICTGGTVSLTATPSNGTGTCTVQWQRSTDNASWNDISGATGNTYTSTALTTNTYFRARINCTGANCDQGNSTSLLISVVADPLVSVVASATGICVGGNVTLNATPSGGVGTCTIQWQSSSDGTNWSPIGGATNNTYVTPALSTLARYRAQVNCSGNGCCN